MRVVFSRGMGGIFPKTETRLAPEWTRFYLFSDYCSYECDPKLCEYCQPDDKCDAAPYERCEFDAVLDSHNCSATEIYLHYYLRWRQMPDALPDSYKRVFPLPCTDDDPCGTSNSRSF